MRATLRSVRRAPYACPVLSDNSIAPHADDAFTFILYQPAMAGNSLSRLNNANNFKTIKQNQSNVDLISAKVDIVENAAGIKSSSSRESFLNSI